MSQRIHQYKRVRHHYKSNLHREPTDREYCRALKIDFKQLEDVKKAFYKYKHIKSLNEPIRGSDDEENNLTHNMLINIIISFTIFDKSSIIRVGTKKEPQVLEHSRFENVTSFKKASNRLQNLFVFSNNLLLS